MAANRTNFDTLLTEKGNLGHDSDENASSNELEVSIGKEIASPDVASEDNEDDSVISRDLETQGSVTLKTNTKKG